MIAVDTSALVAIVLDEPDAEQLLGALAAADRVVITAANWLEAHMVIATRAARRLDTLQALINATNHEIIAIDAPLASIAFDAFMKYGKGRHPAALNFGDCFSYALASSFNVALLYKGNDFALTDVRGLAN